MLKAIDVELAVSLCIFKTSAVSITILPARMSRLDPLGMGRERPISILSPSLFSIFAVTLIELVVMLAIVQPIPTQVVLPGTVYTVISVLAPVLLPSFVFNLKVFAMIFP